MNKKAIGISLVIITAVIGGAVFLLSQPKEATSSLAETRSSTQSTSSTESPADAPAMASAGQYVEYSPDSIADTTGTKLLFFHAPWCPQCRALEADIKAKGVPDGVTIIKVDYDTSQSLRQKYGVTLQTTIVRVDDAGNLVEKYVAYESPTIEAVKASLL